MKLCADVLAFLSAGFLAVPAWYFNHYAHLASRASLYKLNIEDRDVAAAFRRTEEKLAKLRDKWTPRKAWCLHLGTVAGLLATLLAVINSVCDWLAKPRRPSASHVDLLRARGAMRYKSMKSRLNPPVSRARLLHQAKRSRPRPCRTESKHP